MAGDLGLNSTYYVGGQLYYNGAPIYGDPPTDGTDEEMIIEPKYGTDRVATAVETGRTSVDNGDGTLTWTITWSDGTTTTENSGTKIVGGGTTGTDAEVELKTLLAAYGLEELSGALYTTILTGLVDKNNPDALMYSLRNEEAYKKRFAANPGRVKAGLSELSPSTYIKMEDYYRRTMQANGLPAGFYDNNEDFKALIEGDVSVDEFQSRIEDGYNAVMNSAPETKNQLQQLYGVSEGDMVAYFIDPTLTTPLLKGKGRWWRTQAEAAKIAAAGKELGGVQLTTPLAEELQSRNFSDAAVTGAFTQVGNLGELNKNLYGEDTLNQGEQVGAAFGYDLTAQQKLEKKRKRRLGEFQGGGQFSRSQGDSGGLKLGIGKSE